MKQDAPITPVSLSDVTISDPFWKTYMELVRSHVIPYQWEALNDRIEGAAPSYCIHNFSVAAGKKKGEFGGFVFQDSDLYKWLEAASYSLMWHPDKELEAKIDSVVDLMGEAQQEDGYLDTYYIINGLENRFTNLRDNHELYCLGHMLEAAVAYHQATGKDKLLAIGCAYADCVAREFGTEPGKRRGYPGHEVAELALVKLYHVTGNEAYLRLASYFIDERGQTPNYFALEEAAHGREKGWNRTLGYGYYQADKPVREQTEAVGHAVRAVYLYSGMADVARETGDETLIKACETLWDDIVSRKMYITGAIGSSEFGEAFTFSYDLPNDTIYGETCAAIGLVFFARRMFELTRDSKYIDVMERAIYNGVISGMSLDGTSFFYVNPLEVDPVACERDFRKSHVKPVRQKWFGCACCPPNLARLLSSITGYAYETDQTALYMNLFVGGSIRTEIQDQPVSLEVATRYPWEELVTVTVKEAPSAPCTLAIRMPGWCRKSIVSVNGTVIHPSGNPSGSADAEGSSDSPNCHMEKGYLYLTRQWNPGDVVELCFSMPVERIQANPRVREDVGKCAVMRGPLVYCLEEADNGSGLSRIYLDHQPDFQVTYQEDLLGGVCAIRAKGRFLSDSGWESAPLYQMYQTPSYEEKELTFIPYYAWANRGLGEMLVWVHL